MNNRQGPVLIIEPCGCRVDHGIPTRCNEHKLVGKRLNKKDLAAWDLAQDILVHLKKIAGGNMVSELNEDNIIDPIKDWIDINL